MKPIVILLLSLLLLSGCKTSCDVLTVTTKEGKTHTFNADAQVSETYEYKRSGDKITVWNTWISRSEGRQINKTVLEGISTVECRKW